MAHWEMIGTMVQQLMKGATIEELRANGLEGNYAEHDSANFPVDANDASGVPFSALTFASTGNPLADLSEDLAAESKAKATYENLIDLTNDENLIAPLLFLRQREIVHFQRFGEALNGVHEKLAQKKFFMNDMNCMNNKF